MTDTIGGKSIQADVSVAETKAAYSVAAVASNKFVVNIGHPGVRIAFGEFHPDLEVPEFHTAVTMHPLDAISLYKLLQGLLKEIEDEFRANGLIQEVPSGETDG